MAEETDRPTVSTRDHATTRVQLTEWIRTRLPDGADPQVSELSIPAANGMSSETVLFDVTTATDPAPLRCVARLAPEASAVPVFPRYDFAKQFRVMQLVRESTDVPVPQARWYEPDPAWVGSEFFVMDRIDGDVPPDVMPYNFGDSWLYRASRENQARLARASVSVLTRVHALNVENTDLSFLELDRPEPTALRRHVEDQRAYYEWVADGIRHPVLEQAFDWLDAHWPQDEGVPVLSWGDARIGNIMYRDFEPVGVFDWEMVGVGPREIDLGWMIFIHRFFEDIAAQMGLEGMPHFLRRDEMAQTYAELSGYEPRDLDFFTMYAALRHGIVMSRVTRRSIHFGEAEMPDDPDDLIMHRPALEAMLAGTYWDGI